MALFLIFLVAAGLMLAFHARSTERTNRLWKPVAHEQGLDFKPASFFGHPAMHGRIDGFQVRIGVESRSSGDSRTTWTRWEVHHPQVGPAVTLKRQGRMSFMGKLFGRRDVLIGDPLFDDSVVVDAADPAEVQAFLTPVRRVAALELFSVFHGAEITQSSIHVEVQGVCQKPSQLSGTLRRLLDTAHVMSRPDEVNSILAHQEDGDLALAAEELHAFNEHQPNVFTEMLEAELLAETGRHGDAASILDDLGTRFPEDPAVAGWRDLSHLPPPPALADLPGSADEASPAAAEVVGGVGVPVDVRQRVVLDDLFSADRMSWEIVEYFEGTYRGAVVEWSGTVTRANRYERDLDFGVGPGVKATVLLGHAGRSDLISNEVHAIVGLPAQERPDVGSEVRFRGVLTNVDRFSRKLWVQQAALVA